MKELFRKGGSHYYEPLNKNDIKMMDCYDSTFDSDMEAKIVFEGVRPFNEMFDNMNQDMLPTYQDFIKLALDEVKNSKWGKKQTWTKSNELLIQQRAGRGYASFIVETYVLLFLNTEYWDVISYTDRKIDIKFGVDIVMEDLETGKNYYLHVAKDSYWSREAIKRKSARFNGYQQINGHFFIFYDGKKTNKTDMVGHQPFPKEEYIKREVEVMRNAIMLHRFMDDRDNPKEMNKYVK